MGKQVQNGRIIYGDQKIATTPSHMNYGHFILDRLILSKEKMALIDGSTEEQLTAGEMAQAIVNTANALRHLGVKRKEVVAICSENRMEYLITVIAVWCCGLTLTLLNAAYSLNELIHTIDISKPTYIFLSPNTHDKYFKTIVETKLINKYFIYGNSVNDSKLTKFNDFMKTHVDINGFKTAVDPNGKTDYRIKMDVDLIGLAQTALILYSSGTTGLPKGAKLTHLNLITNGSQPYLITSKATFSSTLKCLSVAPWSNTVGIICTLKELINNNTVVFLPRFKEDQYLMCIQKYKVEMITVVPPLVVMFTKSTIIQNYDLSSVKFLYCGGSPLDLSVIVEVKKRFPNLTNVLQGYGMTECSGAVTEETVTDNRQGSVGKVVHGNIIKVVDIETRELLGPHQEGEVCIKGPLLFGGYIGKDLATELDKDGFFATGDICFYDEDGYFFFVDRIKELIKYKTSQVAPSELEAILLQHPAVKDVGVVGKHDSLAGELPTAFVVKKPTIAVTTAELIDFVAAKVSPWKQLRGGVYFVEEIPKVASGKILKRILRDFINKPASKL